MRKDVPLMKEELQHIVPQMEEIQKQIDKFMASVKHQQGFLLNTEQLQKLQTLTNMYQKWNDQLGQIHRQLMQILDEILRPGLGLVEEYNTCLGSTAQSLIDYSIDQIVEHIDDDDDDDQLFPLDNLSSSYNHTDL
ncbi:unnamed protein product [Rotaria sp. Silwood1]|nr:unnamed protein product [Rotaria sp. Silwood1]CAF1688767.1 unnamed protein product [Rotaria sp. Silwood1]